MKIRNSSPLRIVAGVLGVIGLVVIVMFVLTALLIQCTLAPETGSFCLPFVALSALMGSPVAWLGIAFVASLILLCWSLSPYIGEQTTDAED